MVALLVFISATYLEITVVFETKNWRNDNEDFWVFQKSSQRIDGSILRAEQPKILIALFYSGQIMQWSQCAFDLGCDSHLGLDLLKSLVFRVVFETQSKHYLLPAVDTPSLLDDVTIRGFQKRQNLFYKFISWGVSVMILNLQPCS